MWICNVVASAYHAIEPAGAWDAVVTPGLKVALFAILPGTRRGMVIEQTSAASVQGSEFGLGLDTNGSEDAPAERRTSGEIGVRTLC